MSECILPSRMNNYYSVHITSPPKSLESLHPAIIVAVVTHRTTSRISHLRNNRDNFSERSVY